VLIEGKAMAHRVDHLLGGEPIALGDSSLPGRAAADAATLLEELRSGGAVDRPVHAPAAEQRRVRRVDDRVHRLSRNVALHRLEPRHEERI